MKKHNILLVDDDEVSTFFVQHKLSKLEIIGDIYISVDGQDALDKLEEFKRKGISIDLILLDLNMPVMNGFEFLDKYQNMHAKTLMETEVYVVTSSNHSKDSERAKSFDCVSDYVNKSTVVNSVMSILGIED